MAHRPRTEVSRDVMWILLCCVLATGLSMAVALGPLGGIPHVSDEVVYTLQSRLFAGGMRVGPAVDNPSMWAYPFWIGSPVSYGAFTVGWPLLLALGEVFGEPALVNPLLVGSLPWLLYRLGVPTIGREAARMAALAVALSPGVWFLAGSRMSHTSVLVALALLAAVAQRAERAEGWWWAAGAAAGYVVLARPFDAVLLALPLMLWGGLRGPNIRARAGLFGLPLLAAAWVLWDNAQLTGDPFQFPISAWYDSWMADTDRIGCNRLGFGAEVGCAQTLGSLGHDPWKALHLAWEAGQRFDSLFIGVPGGAILAIFGGIVLRARRGWALVALVVLGYALYWSPGRAYGARFWHPLYLVAPLGLGVVLARMGPRWVPMGFLGIGAVLGWHRLNTGMDRYWCVDASLQTLLAEAEVTEGVVFLDAQGSRKTGWPSLGVEAFECDPMLESGDGWMLIDPTRSQGGIQIRHALALPADTAAFMSRYHPGTSAWHVNHDVAEDTRIIERLPLTGDP